MATLLEAVSGDTFGGLTGYKRSLQGNPTRVPTNLPAFRGAQTEPSAKRIRTPQIASSANTPDRKTNVCLPYARITPITGAHNMGRSSPGDLVFVSRTRPDLPG